MLPLIDAVTGAPGRVFPPGGSEVVSRLLQAKPFHQTGFSLGMHGTVRVFITAFIE
ncbi:MAG: hypothetical protein ACI3W5_13110 [Faecousia sp.]